MRRRHRTGSSRTPSLMAGDSVVAVEVVAAVEELMMAAVGLAGRDLVDEVPLPILAIVVTWNEFVLVEVVVVDEVVDVVDVVGVAIVDKLAVGLAVGDKKDIN